MQVTTRGDDAMAMADRVSTGDATERFSRTEEGCEAGKVHLGQGAHDVAACSRRH